ncbi:MAG: hypothetical protein JNL01_08165 [Bdellovibrionales bacterium]|nr:hypothetical protein [Bdellovibrionales bacterium]
MQKILGLVAALTMASLSAAEVWADETYTFNIVKKQEQKAKSRWSLSDWLETREKMRWMDLWLSMHTPSPFEFSLATDYSMASNPDITGLSYRLVAYASAFGLEFSREVLAGNQFRLNGIFHFRIFGNQMQGTHLTLQAGVKQNSGYRNALWGGWMSVYFARYFGIEGIYRSFLDSTPNSTGLRFSGYRAEVGAFIDFKFLRIYGNYFREIEKTAVSLAGSGGPQLGVRLFF